MKMKIFIGTVIFAILSLSQGKVMYILQGPFVQSWVCANPERVTHCVSFCMSGLPFLSEPRKIDPIKS